VQALAPLFAALTEKEVVGHNIISFDLPFLARLGFAPTRLFDTAIASRVVYAGEKADHDLAAVVQRELGEALDKSEQDSDWSRPELTDEQIDYAATDTAVLLPLAEALREKAVERKVEAVVELEMQCGVPVARMAANGVGFDAEAWLAIADAATQRRAELAAEMDALVPNPNCLPGLSDWNWDSTGDVIKVFAAVGTKLKDTKEETIAGIDHLLARLLLDYREAAKSEHLRLGMGGRARHRGPGVRDVEPLPGEDRTDELQGAQPPASPTRSRLPQVLHRQAGPRAREVRLQPDRTADRHEGHGRQADDGRLPGRRGPAHAHHGAVPRRQRGCRGEGGSADGQAGQLRGHLWFGPALAAIEGGRTTTRR
jgi:hypothetical protein